MIRQLQRARAFALLLVLLALSACGGQRIPPNLTPVGQVAWRADKVLMAFEGIQNAAIGMNKIARCQMNVCAPLFSDANTRTVIRIIRPATLTIEASPAGWRGVSTTALDSIRKELDAAGKAELSAWLLVVETLLAEP